MVSKLKIRQTPIASIASFEWRSNKYFAAVANISYIKIDSDFLIKSRFVRRFVREQLNLIDISVSAPHNTINQLNSGLIKLYTNASCENSHDKNQQKPKKKKFTIQKVY